MMIFLLCVLHARFIVMFDACEQVTYNCLFAQIHEVIYKNEFPEYGKGIGYFVSCLSSEAQNDAVGLMYKTQIDFDRGIGLVNTRLATIGKPVILKSITDYNEFIISKQHVDDPVVLSWEKTLTLMDQTILVRFLSFTIEIE